MRSVLEGSQAAAEAVRLARVKVVSAYPITPQTHIVEELAKFCAEGSLDGRFICVESEHSAMASVIGAASGGVRTFTASSSHGLALMHEMLHWAAGARLPIVMAEVNRALGPGWNLWMDQTDSLSQRDTGWIQLYCADGQEVLDTTLQAYRLAEAVNLPVMVTLDAFFLSHTYEPVDVPTQDEVDAFLPPFVPKFRMDTAAPLSLHGVAPINVYMEMRRSIQMAMEAVPEVFAGIEAEFQTRFGRRWGAVDAYRLEDAEIVLVTSGTAAGTARVAIDQLREAGEKAGMLRIKMFRPFPVREVRQALAKARKVAVLDRNCSFGAGGIFASELRSALYGAATVPVWSYITGLGGRDVTVETIMNLYTRTRDAVQPETESVWLELKEELLQA
ncbi:MAG TPA: pyruvate ferredoxin oxidoreductase [bacterium]|nr:pyruvate ferredoxin oxidoreductase [bacterium]HPR89356.1 pyruvate ferredoxin oxidoreductase [bacterium]